MICKFCGSQLENGGNICPNCGKAADPHEGGNGFWDMVSGKPADVSGKVTNESNIQKPYPGFLLYAVAAISVVSIIISIFSLVLIRMESRFIKQEIANIQTQVDIGFGKQSSDISAVIDLLPPVPDSLQSSEVINTTNNEDTTAISEEQASPDETPKVAGILFEQELEQYSGKTIIQFHIAGEVSSFVWEKQNNEGIWQPIEFIDGKNEQLGIDLFEDTENGDCGLIAAGMSENIVGTYRFTAVHDENNIIFTTIIPMGIAAE